MTFDDIAYRICASYSQGRRRLVFINRTVMDVSQYAGQNANIFISCRDSDQFFCFRHSTDRIRPPKP